MAVYAIAMFSITNRAVYGRYQAQFMGVMNRYKGTVLAADEHPVVVEGDWDRDKVVMLSFANEADWRTYQAHPAHQEVIATYLGPILQRRASVQVIEGA